MCLGLEPLLRKGLIAAHYLKKRRGRSGAEAATKETSEEKEDDQEIEGDNSLELQEVAEVPEASAILQEDLRLSDSDTSTLEIEWTSSDEE